MLLRSILGLIGAVAMLAGTGTRAETVELVPDHPERYVVVPGDTLWDISSRFLRDPWLWPEIWDTNPQIANPHLIYPGDEITLAFDADGRPILRVTRGTTAAPSPRGRPTVRLSPQVRELPRDAAIPTLPIEKIRAFLNRARVVSERELDGAPYVVSLGKEHMIGAQAMPIYVRGLDEAGLNYAVYNRGPALRHATTGELLGYQALHVADATLEQGGDPATFMVTSSRREVRTGDRLFTRSMDISAADLTPRVPEERVMGNIVSVVDGVSQIGQYQVVVLDLGTDDGLRQGDVLAVYQAGPIVRDYQPGAEPQASPSLTGNVLDFLRTRRSSVPVKLPDERAAIVLVFRPYERASYALVMKATRAINVMDVVTNP